MTYPFPFIDTKVKPANPSLYLCKPNKQTIGKLTHASHISISLKSGTDMSELSFTIPKNIKVKDKWQRYKYFDQLRIKYIVRVKAIWGTDYYVIDAPKLDNGNDQWTVHCFLLPYQLADKKFYSYSTVASDGTDSPINITQALTDALSKSYSWSINHIDDSLKNIYRSFQIDDQTGLDFITTITQKYNAIVVWDTINNKVSMYDATTFTGINKGFRISEKKYLKSLEEDISDDMITRLHCFGADDISLDSVNPTGQDYVEDYTYFIGSFERDDNKKITAHSEWMSDSLCNALLDYQELIQSKTGQFTNLLTQLDTNQSSLLSLQGDLTTLQTNLNIIQDRVTVFTNSGDYFYVNQPYNGTGWSYHAGLNDFQQYAIMGKSTNSVSCQIDGLSYNLNSSWQVLRKINSQDATNIVIPSGQNGGTISFIITMITSDEYSTSGNESALIEKYNLYAKQDQINTKQAQIDSVNTSISNIQDQITLLKTSLSVNNNFTQTQLREWDNFIKEETFSDSNYTDPNDLMKDGKAELAKRQQPTESFNVSIVNFLQIVECQKDWNKLYLNDIVTIYYNNGAEITASIPQMDIDFDNGTIGLQISNVKHVQTDQNKFLDMYQKTIQSATTLNKRKSTWNSAQYNKQNLDNYINSAIYTSKQPIIAGVNNTEAVNNFGHVSQDGNNITILYRACLLSSTDGGRTWTPIFTPQGINADAIIGQLMLDNQTSIVSSDGSVQLTHTGASFGNQSIAIEGGLPSSQIDSDIVNNAQFGAQAKDQIDNLVVSGLGGVNYIAKNQCISGTVDLSSASDVSHSGWGISLQYNQVNGFTVPDIHISGTYTISFVAYANKDNVDLQMNLNTNTVEDMVTENTIRIGTTPQIYQWVIDYNDPNLATLDDYLRFWQGDIEGLIVLTDIQLEFGKFRSSWRANASD